MALLFPWGRRSIHWGQISHRCMGSTTWKVFSNPKPPTSQRSSDSPSSQQQQNIRNEPDEVFQMRPTTTLLPAAESSLPQNIIIIRHGESMGNEDESIYATTADWKVPLSERGRRQARMARQRIAQIINDPDMPVLYYVSPYVRTQQTLQELQLPNPVWYTREEPRLREQDFGNFQCMRQILQAKRERPKFGRFFFRFPNGGESGADVFDRVSAFTGTFVRDMQQLGAEEARKSTAILVTHGITSRLFVMKWLHWSVADFEQLHNPPNCGILHLKMTEKHGYQLSEASRRLIRGPEPHWTGLGKALRLGEILQARQRQLARRSEENVLSTEDRKAFDSMPDAARGL